MEKLIKVKCTEMNKPRDMIDSKKTIFGIIYKTGWPRNFLLQKLEKTVELWSCERSFLSVTRFAFVEVLDSVMGCDLGNICAKAER
jgi:hypothetical protein